MNHVFLFQVHKEPELLDRILTRLDSTNHFYAVNIDKKCNCISEMTNVLKKHNKVIDISMDNVMHGGFSFTDCTIRQMKRLLDNREYHFDYYHTLSGQDYPCVSNNILDSWFEVNNGTSYCMMDSPEQAKEWRKGKYKLRLKRWYWSDVFNTQFAIKLHLGRIMTRLTSTTAPCVCERGFFVFKKTKGGVTID